jgi:hypothetical protein
MLVHFSSNAGVRILHSNVMNFFPPLTADSRYGVSRVTTLTRGPGRLKHSDSAPVLQYGSGPSSDFLAKILGVDTALFLCNTLFYFLLSSLLHHTSRKRRTLTLFAILQLVFAYVADGRRSIPTEVLL